MKLPKEDQIDIELITFHQSALLERVIIDFGKKLCTLLIEADRYDEVAALGEFIGEFTLLASVYGEQTNCVREDLGVSLNEAAIMKLHAIKHKTGSLEWKYYVDDTKNMLDDLKIS
ncbi:MAG TPA: hypothetical protein VLG36_00555 [Candidatus Chromulinivoraceae bacterium]|nr:hypothetical protein [Candidatus Chromulinivoraceae bacterium]